MTKLLLMMRLTIFILTLMFMQVSATTFGQKVTLVDSSISYEQVFREIRKQTGYGILIRNTDFNTSSRTDVNFQNTPLERVLGQLLEGTQLSYLINEKTIIIRRDESVIGEINDYFSDKKKVQQLTVHGTVNDTSGMPLSGVAVRVKGTGNGTITNDNGAFTLQNVDEGAILELSMLGFTTLEVKVENSLPINVTMKLAVQSLDETVVIGYGSVKKKDLTGSVSTLSSEELSKISAHTLDQALSGLVSGVFVRQGTGEPGGAGISVQIRGMTALISNNDPLYVIDGVPIMTTQEFGSGYGGEEIEKTNPLAAIPISSIEKISVLKGASASAIYGSRAANGVVIVTTKKGKQGQAPQVEVGYKYTVQSPVDQYNVLDAEQYRQVMTRIAENTSPEASPLRDQILNSPESYFGDANINWQDEMLRNGGGHNVNLSVRGGTQSSTYAISASLLDQEGIVKNTGFERYNVHTSLNTDLNEWFTVGTNINYSLSNRAMPVGGQNLNMVGFAGFRPDLGAYDEDGNITVYDDMIAPSVYLENDGNNKAQSLYGNIFSQINFGDHLSVKSSLNVALSDNSGFSFFRPVPASYAIDGRLETINGTNLSTTFDNTLHYQGMVGNERHEINAVLGASWYKVRDDFETVGYRGFPFWQELRNVSAADRTIFHRGGEAVSGLASYFGRINYSYDQRYLVTLTTRVDGSSKFGPNNKWGIFPSAALAWNISNEQFMSSSTIFDNLKLRVGLGETGSSNVPDFLFDLYFQPGNPYADENGLAPTSVPNYDIRWQNTLQFDAAVDFALFDYRLNGTIGYFSKYVSDVLTYRVLPYNTGQPTQLANVGEISNKGLEIDISGDIIHKSDFGWKTSLNFTHVKNRVEDLYNSVLNPFGTITNEDQLENRRYSPIFGYHVVSIFQSDEEIDALNAASPTGFYQQSNTSPGDYKMEDLNGDGVINIDDQDVLGYSEPNYFGGITNNIRYKGLELSFLLQFTMGSSKSWDVGQSLLHTGSPSRNVPPGSNLLVAALDSWSEDNPEAAYARLAFDTPSLNTASSSKLVYKADYLRLKYVRLNYIFPDKWVHNLGLSRIRANLSLANLWTLTDYPGLDPESSSIRTTGLGTGTDGYYPLYKSMSVGLDIQF